MKQYDPVTYLRDDGAIRTDEILGEIGAGDSVAATNNIGPHLTHRADVVLFAERHLRRPGGTLDPVDWIVIDTLAHPWPLTPGAYRQEISALLEGDKYGVWTTGYESGILLLRRGYSTSRNSAVLARLEFP